MPNMLGSSVEFETREWVFEKRFYEKYFAMNLGASWGEETIWSYFRSIMRIDLNTTIEKVVTSLFGDQF